MLAVTIEDADFEIHRMNKGSKMKARDLQDATWFRAKEMSGLFYYQGRGAVIRIGDGAVVTYDNAGSMEVDTIVPAGSETIVRL